MKSKTKIKQVQCQTVERKQDRKTMVVTFRIFQSICFGIFTLGLSMTAGDISTGFKFPISSFSIATTLFGFVGSIITGVQAKACEKW